MSFYGNRGLTIAARGRFCKSVKAAARRGGFLLGLDGRIWACQGGTRRGSKRQKDPADITRRLEAHPRLGPTAPAEIRQELA